MTRDNNIKLLGESEMPTQQPTPTYPRTNLQFGPLGGGFAIQILFADDIAISKVFDGPAEEQLCNLLIQRRKETKQQLEMIRNIGKSKL